MGGGNETRVREAGVGSEDFTFTAGAPREFPRHLLGRKRLRKKEDDGMTGDPGRKRQESASCAGDRKQTGLEQGFPLGLQPRDPPRLPDTLGKQMGWLTAAGWV